MGSIVPASDWLKLATRSKLAEQARFALTKIGSPNKTGTRTQH
jgi:hypothetical protein